MHSGCPLHTAGLLLFKFCAEVEHAYVFVVVVCVGGGG